LKIEDRTVLGHFRRLFLTGMAIILPLIITIWVLKLLFDLVHGVTTPLILRILALAHFPYIDDPAFSTYAAPLIGFVITVLLVMLVGVLATNLLGRQVVAAFDRLMLRIPLIKGIYGAARQLLDAFHTKSDSFQRVVAVEYPSRGIYTLGFVTRDSTTLLSAKQGRDLKGHALIFMPTSPNPTSGWLVAVPDDRMIPLDMTIEEGAKMIVSGGLVLPPRWLTR
jgi:uncharacterized membrane protein